MIAFRFFLALIITTLLLGCGFQLRGVGSELPPRFKATYLQQSDTYIYNQIKRAININGGRVVEQEEADIRVYVSPLRETSRQVALSGDGSLKEYERTYHVYVQVSDLNTGLQYGSRDLSVTRNVQIDDREILAGEEQSDITKRIAVRELASAVIHYLNNFE